jgi:lysophospholipase L1-like esterase
MRLICFGDSWTAGHGVETDSFYKERASPNNFIIKLREQNSWVKWTAQKLEVPFVNMGVSGYGNEYIFKDILHNKENNHFEENDIIIVMFSYPYRYKSKDTYDVPKLFWKMENELREYKHFYFNSFYPTFKNEEIDVTQLPECFINPNGCVADILKEYEIKNDISVWEYGSRSVWNDQENFWEGDYHPNVLGYKIIGENIYDEIKRRI